MPNRRLHASVQVGVLIATLVAGAVLIAWAFAIRPLGPFADSESDVANEAYSYVIAIMFYVAHLVFVSVVLCVAIPSKGFGRAPLTSIVLILAACSIAYPILLIVRWLEPLGALSVGIVLVSWLALSAAIIAWYGNRKPAPLENAG